MSRPPAVRYGLSLVLAALALASPAAAQEHFPTTGDVDLMLRYLVEDGETPGIVVGFIDADGSTRILEYGEAGPGARPLGSRSAFEIGSITKTFTAALLADMVARGQMALDDPVQKYLPDGVSMPTWGGREITLEDLSTHHSGLPRMPDNFAPADPANPYADYTADDLYAFLSGHELRRAPGAEFEYSNLAVGLLGHVLELATGMTYEQLVRARVLDPLGMDATGITLEGDLASWMTKGHDDAGEVVSYWDAMALAGAGGLRSSAEEMLVYLAAQLGSPGSEIERAIRMTHEPRVEMEDGAAAGLGWGIRQVGERRILSHGGGTAGYSTWVGFDPDLGVAAVMLTNTGDFDDDLAGDLLRRGAPISTPTVEVPSDVLESYVGMYGPSAPQAVAVRLEDEGWLTMQVPGNVRFRLYADSDTSFYVRRTPWRLVFQRDETGRVSGAVADLAGTERRMPRRDDDLPDPRVLAGNLVASTAVVALSPEEMARYEGDYVVAMGSANVRFRVFVENGELMAQPDAQRSTRLLRQAEHTFVTAVDTDIRLVFAVENGRAERVTLHQSGQSASGPRLEPGEEPPPPPAQPEVLDLPVTPEDIARYEGTYLLAVGERTLELRIFGRDGALISQAAGQNESPLRHQGDHVFVPGFDDRVRVVFTVENDRAVSLTLHQGGGVFEGPRVPSVAGEQSGGAILITGASSGLGRATAETLASKGYFVYAGARSEEDLRALNAIDNIEAIRLDVTIQSEIDAAVQTVIDGGRGLHAIVNNAGVGLMSPLIELEEDDLDFILDVNVYGPYRITRAFAPLLIESGGRVVNIGSIAGFQTTSFYGPYSISKHALEAYTDALAIELAKFGIRVSIIDPGGFNSDIGRNIYERLQASDVDIEGSLYSEEWQSNWVLGGGDLSGAPGPEFIVEIIEHALFDDDPQQRYMVVGDPGRAERTMRSLFRRMLQLNQNQPYTYDRDGLIELLDAEIARMEGDLRR